MSVVEQAQLDAVQQKMVNRNFTAAENELAGLLEREPENPDLMYMAAVCKRYQGRFSEALSTLEALKRISPGHGRAHQEQGHNYRDMGEIDNALRAYGRATYFNPALEVSFREQVRLYRQTGELQRASSLQQQLDKLLEMPQPLRVVVDLIHQNKLLKAEDICRQFLQKLPDNVQGMRLLADIGLRLGVLEDAEYLLDSAVAFEPDNVAAHIDYIQILRKRQKFAAARAQAEKLLEKDPDNPQYQSIFAIECLQTGETALALDYFNRILTRLPNDPVTLTSKGHALKTRGDSDAAVAAYQQAVAAHPYHGEAYYSLANLKTYRFTTAEVEAMLALEGNSNLALMDQVYLYFALGKAFEDQQDYDSSFSYYARGNALKKAQSCYQAETMSRDLEAQRRVCTGALFAERQDAGHPAPDPIFIVGLPRAGSTLLEQILSSHSQVDGTLELPNILSLSQRLRRRHRETAGSGQKGCSDYPAILAELSAEELRAFGEEYLRDTRIHRQGAPYFIDKMPNNFRHIGLIKLILPNARIIDARRNPMACCWSGFKQLFADGQEFSYSLTDLGQYYRDYVELMAHWDHVLPGAVLRVNNEDLIMDFENQVRRLLDFCGLAFEESCLRYYETRRNVRTPSSEQVRQPISASGVDQWKHYQSHLMPLREALGPLAVESDRFSDSLQQNDQTAGTPTL